MAVVVLNEEDRLRACLESVVWADEIVVVDGGSSDKTAAIAREFTDRVLFRAWDGYGTQKNFALGQCRGDWVLSLDADERVSDALREEMQATLRAGTSRSGFYLARQNLFQGRWVRRGGFYPDWQLRLFRRGQGAFVERAVHEAVRLEGPAGAAVRPADPRELPEHRRRRRAAQSVLGPRRGGAGQDRAWRQPGGSPGSSDLAVRVDVRAAGGVPRRVAGPRAGGAPRPLRVPPSRQGPGAAALTVGCVTRAVAVIPSRWASVRFPGKALVVIRGKPLVQHVWERAQELETVERTVVATDDERIAAAVRGFGGAVVMTGPECPNGTDRVAQATRDWPVDLVVNLQGDEPAFEVKPLDQLVRAMAEDPAIEMGTLAHPVADESEHRDPNAVKVVLDQSGHALYFSRAPIPYARQAGLVAPLRHVGIYVFRHGFLQRYARLAPTPLEQTERLEQLRALEHGVRIRVLLTPHGSIGVDVPADVDRLAAYLESREGRGR